MGTNYQVIEKKLAEGLAIAANNQA